MPIREKRSDRRDKELKEIADISEGDLEHIGDLVKQGFVEGIIDCETENGSKRIVWNITITAFER